MDTIDRMRKSYSHQVDTIAPASPAVNIPFCDDRVSLLIWPRTTAVYTFRYGQNPAGGDLGLISVNTGPLVIDIQHHGAMVKGPWQVYCEDGATSLSYVETLLTCPCETSERRR